MSSRTSLLPRVRRLMRREAARREALDGAGAPAAPLPRAPAEVSAASDVDDARLATIEAEARHHRNRLALYRARLYGNKPTSLTHLRELEQTAAAAEQRLAHARGRQSSDRRASP
jgi:hypothetical protein